MCVELAGWRGKQKKQWGNIWNDQSYQDIRVEIGFILMDFGFRMSRVREGHRFEMSRDTVTVSAAESGWGAVREVCV